MYRWPSGGMGEVKRSHDNNVAPLVTQSVGQLDGRHRLSIVDCRLKLAIGNLASANVKSVVTERK